jgi:hypothetical protein
MVARHPPWARNKHGPQRVLSFMKATLILAATLLAVTSASAEDAWTRLRNASANELCWDTVRNFAREKHPTVRPGDASLTPASLAASSPIKESRKAFPGIRTC